MNLTKKKLQDHRLIAEHEQDDETDNIVQEPEGIDTDDEITNNFLSQYFEVPEYFKKEVQVDSMIKTARPDGACLFNCASDWLLGLDKKMSELIWIILNSIKIS